MGENSEIYDLLTKVKNGYDPGWISYSKYDNLLDDIRFNEKTPGLSVVIIAFDNIDDYLDLYEDLTDDDIYWIQRFLNGDYEPDSGRYEIQEGWSYGYIYEHYLNSENKEKIDKIVSMILKDSRNKSIGDRMSKFYDDFEDAAQNIYREWEYVEHNCKMDKGRQEVVDELGNNFINFGIREVSPLYKYRVSVNILIKLFDTIGNSSMSLKELLQYLIEKYHKSSYGWYHETYYSISCDDYDYESFNRNAEWYIDKTLEELYNSEEYLDVDEFFELKNIIEKDYGFDKWIRIPTKENLYFKVDEINPKTNKIVITFRNNESDNREEKRLVTYDELKRMQTQYELFNEIRKKRRKNFLI